MMPNGDLWDRFFHPTLTLMIDSYILAHRIRISEILPWDSKSYLTHAILPRLSSEGYMHWFIRMHAHGFQVMSLLC